MHNRVENAIFKKSAPFLTLGMLKRQLTCRHLIVTACLRSFSNTDPLAQVNTFAFKQVGAPNNGIDWHQQYPLLAIEIPGGRPK